MRQAILSPKLSPRQHLLDHGDDGYFFLMTGLQMPLGLLYLPIEVLSATSTLAIATSVGRKALLIPHSEFGLFLFCLGSTMTIKHLWLILDLPPVYIQE